ncbi:MFS transporter [Aquipuribacter hungaricus]|uniref:MFS transporter n=1 Tax=Aquipuribacter hungaricus TaxID=545624 RepID=A0ABV7WLQ2_9MICO
MHDSPSRRTDTPSRTTPQGDDPTEARGFAAYRRVLAVRGMPSLYLVGVLARLPHVGGGLALTLYVVEGLGRGYLAAGLVTAALTVGIALGSPWRGRLVDRVGLRRALVPSIVSMPVLWTAAAFSPYPVLLPVALLAGLLAVPVFTVVRQAIGVIVPVHSRRAGFALDSVLVEASFVAGPPLVVVAVTQVGPEVALVAIGIGESLAGLVLAWLNPRLRDDPGAVTDVHSPDVQAPGGTATDGTLTQGEAVTTTRGGDRPARRRLLPRWMTPGLLAMYACSFGTAFVLSGSEVGVIAVLRGLDQVEFIAWVFAVWGLASGAGGLVYGAMRRGASSPLVLLAWLSLATLPLALATTPLLLLVLVVPAGVLVAPVLSASADGVSRRTEDRNRGEAMGWHGTATTAGFSLGAPLAGAMADSVAPWTAFVLVATVSGVLSLVGLGVLRRHRGRVAAGAAAGTAVSAPVR